MTKDRWGRTGVMAIGPHPYIARIVQTARYLMLELTVWQVILKQAATWDFPKYPISHAVSVIAMTRLNI